MKAWFCQTKKRFLPTPKVRHYCLKQKCRHLRKKHYNEVVYKVWGLYVCADLKPTNPRLGQFFAGNLPRWKGR